MTLLLRTFALMSALVPVALSGCSSQAPTTSTLSGSIDQASFPSAVAKITVTSSLGKSTSAAVGAEPMHRHVATPVTPSRHASA